MHFTQKSIIFGVVFFLGMLLGYNSICQPNSIPLSIEATSENYSSSACFDFDSEIYEEDQLVDTTDFLIAAETTSQHQYLHLACRLPLPSFTVWQPPKLS